MLKMSSFDMNTGTDAFVPLINCNVDKALLKTMDSRHWAMTASVHQRHQPSYGRSAAALFPTFGRQPGSDLDCLGAKVWRNEMQVSLNASDLVKVEHVHSRRSDTTCLFLDPAGTYTPSFRGLLGVATMTAFSSVNQLNLNYTT